jgi:hypothetical protein
MRRPGPTIISTLLAAAVLAGCSAVPDRCPGPPDGWAVYPDPAVAARAPRTLPRGLRIVTLGSSSTQGTGASPEATRSYPAQLGRVLNWRHPEAGVEVINKGIAGEIVTKNLARLNRDVLALRPDLVLWQVGTNDAIYLGNATAVMVQVRRGIRRIRDAGAGLVLISGSPCRTRSSTSRCSRSATPSWRSPGRRRCRCSTATSCWSGGRPPGRSTRTRSSARTRCT